MYQFHRNTYRVQLSIRQLYFVSLLFIVSTCNGQNTGSANAQGNCIVANTGSNTRITQTCTVIDPELFKQFKDIANGTKGNTKLLGDALVQLRAISKQMQDGWKEQTIAAPNGIAIGGGTVTNPTVNNNTMFGVPQPPPPITWIAKPAGPGYPRMGSTIPNNPGVDVFITVTNTFPNPIFAVECDRPCTATDVITGGAFSPGLFGTARPNVALFSVGLISGFLTAGSKVTLTVRSIDNQTIQVRSAHACFWSNNPGDSPGSFRCSD